MYAVIRWLFENTVAVVPMAWLDRYKEVDGAWYPPSNIEERIRRLEAPKPGWQHYSAKLYVQNISSFEKALKHASDFVNAVDSEKEQAKIASQLEPSDSITSSQGLIEQSMAVASDISSNFELSGLFDQSASAASNLSFNMDTSGLFGASSTIPAEQETIVNVQGIDEISRGLIQQETNHSVQAPRNKRIFTVMQRPEATISTPPDEQDVTSIRQGINEDNRRSSFQGINEVNHRRPSVQRITDVNHRQTKQDENSNLQEHNDVRIRPTQPTASYNSQASRNKRPFTVIQNPEVSNEQILRKVMLLQSDIREVQSTTNRIFTMMQETGDQQNDGHQIPSKMRSIEEFDRLESSLEDANFQKKLHRFLLPYAVDGLCGRSVYAILGFLGSPELWSIFSLRGQRDGKRRIDTTRLFTALKKFCSSSGFKYKSLDDAVSLYLKKFQTKRNKRTAGTDENENTMNNRK